MKVFKEDIKTSDGMKKNRLLYLVCWAILSTCVVSCIDEESFDGAINLPSENVEAVDLGLPSGTLWASCNLGAYDVLDYGDYFAWGETTPRKNFELSQYRHYEMSEYGYSKNIGTNISTTKYDAALEQWGDDWSMPSVADFEELMKYCAWTWIKYDNSVWGYKVEGKNGNWIFLPASGSYEESSIEDLDVNGGYWSSNMSNNELDFAKILRFDANDYAIDKYARFHGLAIRPIKNKNKKTNEDDIDFTYEVAGDQYTLDYYVVSPIQFKITSAKAGGITWDFGCDWSLIEILDNNPMAPIVKYKRPGLYYVTLTIKGVGSTTYPILINDIVPIPSIAEVAVAGQASDLVLLNDAKVSFSLDLPNPEKKVVKYIWHFPEGAKDENGQYFTTLEYFFNPEIGALDCPKNISFTNLGSQRVTVDAIFDFGSAEERQLEQSYIDIQVASPIEVPTLYYAQVGGNIKAMKLLNEKQLHMLGNPKVFPYDMGVSAGGNPFNLLYGATAEGEHWVYILDAGKQYYYVNDNAGVLGDGKITAMRVDGTDVNTVITNEGGAAFNDPYQGCVYDGYIYYNDRSRGFSKVKMTSRNLVEGKTSDNFRTEYVATNERIPYYNRGIAYGAISTGIYRDKNNVWWWGKNYSGNGIYRFADSDIYTTQQEASRVGNPFEIVLPSIKFTSYAIDEERGKLFIWGIHGVGKGAGFVEYELPALDATVAVGNALGYVKMEAKAVNTTADEPVCVKQMAIDVRTGYVYFGFRAEEGDVWTSSGWRRHTGIVFYDPETKQCENYGETNDEILGVTINPNPTKLF